MTKLRRLILAAAVTAAAAQTCYGQWGVAAGAGAEQWNRMRDLDQQAQQNELARKQMEMEIKRMEREAQFRAEEQKRAEEARRRYDLYTQKRQEHAAAMREFANKNGASGRQATIEVYQQLNAYGQDGYPVHLSGSDVTAMLGMEVERAQRQFENQLDSEISLLFQKNKEYSDDRVRGIFRNELNKFIIGVSEKTETSPSGIPSLVETIHLRVQKILFAEKSNKKSAKAKVQG